jgi:acylphosphatase
MDQVSSTDQPSSSQQSSSTDQASPSRPREFYCIVYGNVQGVAFRAFAKKEAAEFGVTGYAKNLENGTVEVVAQGPEDKLRLFAARLYVGTEDAEVESAEIQWGPITEPFTQFDML